MSHTFFGLPHELRCLLVADKTVGKAVLIAIK